MKTFGTLSIILILISMVFVSGIVNGTLAVPYFGNISDWAMVLVTIITAYFLYETLQAQKDVQSDQEKINRLQTLEIRKKLKPNLQLEQLIRTSDSYGFIIKVCDNPVQNMHISSKKIFTISNYDIPRKQGNRFEYTIPRIVNDKTPIRFTDMYFPIDELTEIDNIINDFEISFEDEFGFKYSKTIIIEYNTQTYRVTHRTSNDHFHLI